MDPAFDENFLEYIQAISSTGHMAFFVFYCFISQEIERSRNVVANFLRAPGEYEIKKSGERPTKLGKREKRRITMISSNSMTSPDEIRSIYCQTEWSGVILPFFHVYVPFRYKLQSIQRFEKREKGFSTRNFGGGSLVVWTTFSSFGAIELAFVPTKMSSVDYQQVFENHLLPYYNRFPQKNFIFQQDNAPVHVSCSIKNSFQSRNIVLMVWPSRSPDLNPMKNLWGILQLSSIEDLKKTWSKSDPAIFKNMSTSMTEGIFQVIRGRGSCIEY
uniref:DDE_3 domain-containing protein n=1 Tax=Heterorhabditis bacteriophora TaxID=37862 RepID=A0A1I7WXA0_HETBA